MTQNRAEAKEERPGAATAILDATRQLIVEEGVDSFSISDVARRADVSRTLIYHYYRNRENLLLEAIRYAAHQTEQIRPNLGEEAIEQSTRLHIEHPEIGRFFFQLLLTGRPLPSLSQRVFAAIEDLERFKAEHAPNSDLDPAFAIISVHLAQMAWGFGRGEIARHLGISVEEADQRWIAQLRRSARVGMQALANGG